jgi:16S rRNA (cytidine1402-2'-O)-methyltransferase
VVAREVTKVHEEFLRGRADEVLEQLRARAAIKGEITLLIGKAVEGGERPAAAGKKTVRARVEEVMRMKEVDEKAALKEVARELGISKSEAYRQLQRTRK